jgi:hypothetical protein
MWIPLTGCSVGEVLAMVVGTAFSLGNGSLEHGLRIVQPMTLMSIGLYNEPQGVFLPSIVY